MKNETKLWLNYSLENLKSARVLLQNNLFNPCLQNIQQSVEKSIKALLIENSEKAKKTHSISELNNMLVKSKIRIGISVEDCEFLDSVYLPSKYPLRNVLPYYEPDKEICDKGISIAENVFKNINEELSGKYEEEV
jgi:HEPN domain-containing protein